MLVRMNPPRRAGGRSTPHQAHTTGSASIYQEFTNVIGAIQPMPSSSGVWRSCVSLDKPARSTYRGRDTVMRAHNLSCVLTTCAHNCEFDRSTRACSKRERHSTRPGASATRPFPKGALPCPHSALQRHFFNNPEVDDP